MFDEYPQTTAQYLLFKQINTRFRNPEISNIVLYESSETTYIAAHRAPPRE